MEQANPQSVLNNAAAMVRGFWAVLVSGFGRIGAAMDPDLWITAWVEGIFRRLDDLLARYRAGDLALVANTGTFQAEPVCADGRARGWGIPQRSVTRATQSATVVAGACDADCMEHQHIARTWKTVAAGWVISVRTAIWRAFVGLEAGFLKKRGVGVARSCDLIVPGNY